MSKRGLTKKSVLDAAETLVTRHGAEYLTTVTLAKELGIKPASLYNHINGTEELRAQLALRAIHALSGTLSDAIETRTRDEAFFALADAYRAFAHRTPGLYHLILKIPMEGNDTLSAALPDIVTPIIRLLDGFSLSPEEKNHWQRILRTVMHGFSTQELCGFFSHSDTNRSETYRLAIATVLQGIKEAEINHRNSEGGNTLLCSKP